MRSVEQVRLRQLPERPHRLGSYRNRGARMGDMFWIGEAAVHLSQLRTPGAKLAEQRAGSRDLASSHMGRRSRR